MLEVFKTGDPEAPLAIRVKSWDHICGYQCEIDPSSCSVNKG